VEIEGVFMERTRDEWQAFASEVDCCLEPVLDLVEALDTELIRAREMVVEVHQPGANGPVRLLGVPIKMSATPGDPHRLPGPGLGEHTDEVLREAGFPDEEIDQLAASGAVARAAGEARGSFL
jgi:alpha-methylacyl-CoA racemase